MEQHSAVNGASCGSFQQQGGALRVSHCVEDDGYKEDTLRGSLCLKLWMRQKSPGAGGTEIGGDLG